MRLAELILAVGGLLAAGVAASLLAAQMRVPGLLLFLAVGMVLGSDVTGLVPFEDYDLARDIGIVALSLILFDGGMSAGWSEIRPVLGLSVSLATVGTLITALVTGLTAAWLFDLSILEGLLLGAVLSSTDGAAVFALLRGSRLRRRLARALEGESGLNDPVAVLLVVGLISWLQKPDYGLADMAWLLVRELGIGLITGLAVGSLASRIFERLRLSSAGLYPVASLATAAIAFGAAATLHGSGFLAVYLAGLALGSASIPARRTVAAFHDGIGWVAQIGLFVTLGLLVNPAELPSVALQGTVLALALILVARPLAVLAAGLPFGLSNRELTLVGAAGLRGAVPVVLATFVVVADVPGAEHSFAVAFFAVVLSTLVQGTAVEPLAKRLRLTTRQPALPPVLEESGVVHRLGAEVLEFPIGSEDAIAGQRVRDLALPREAVVNVIVRAGRAIPPRGSTVLRAGDELHILVQHEVAREVRVLVGRWRSGPVGAAARVRPAPPGRKPVFSSWSWSDADGDAARPERVRGVPVLERLRVRRDAPGTLVLLGDGRYAVTGGRSAIGSRAAVASWAIRRLEHAREEEQAWFENVVGALAADRPFRRASRPAVGPERDLADGRSKAPADSA